MVSTFFLNFLSLLRFTENLWYALATAFRLWKVKAEQGNAKAQYNLGVMYADGNSTLTTMAIKVKPLLNRS